MRTCVRKQHVLRIGTTELRHCTTARLQELVVLIQPGKSLAMNANRIMAMVTETSLDGTLYAPRRRRAYLGGRRRKARRREHR